MKTIVTAQSTRILEEHFENTHTNTVLSLFLRNCKVTDLEHKLQYNFARIYEVLIKLIKQEL